MTVYTFNSLVESCRETVQEIMPWDLIELIEKNPQQLILDVREQNEYDAMHIKNSLFVPRGLLETACEFGYEETHPTLANARNEQIVIVCRSGNRSLLAAKSMQSLGYIDVISLQTGLRGWNDYEQALVNLKNETVDIDDADDFFTSVLREDQKIKHIK